MELQNGRVINGKIVLDNHQGLEEGAEVNVWVGDPDKPVKLSADELALIREGQSAAERGELVDARAFLRELQQAG